MSSRSVRTAAPVSRDLIEPSKFKNHTRIIHDINFHHVREGWYATAILRVSGTAAASCHLLHSPAGTHRDGGWRRDVVTFWHNNYFLP